MPNNPWGLLGPLPPNAGMSEEEARAAADQASLQEGPQDPPDLARRGKRLAYFGQLTPEDMQGVGFSDYSEILRRAQEEMARAQTQAEIESGKNRIRAKHGFGLLPDDVIQEKDIGLTPGDDPAKPLGLGTPQSGKLIGPGGNPWAEAIQSFGLPISAANELGQQFKGSSAHVEAEQMSAAKMLEDYLTAEDIKRMAELKKKLVNQAVSPVQIQYPQLGIGISNGRRG